MTDAALARVVMGSAGSGVSREGSVFTTAGSIAQSATCTTRSPHLTDKGAGERGMPKKHRRSACERLQPKWLRTALATLCPGVREAARGAGEATQGVGGAAQPVGGAALGVGSTSAEAPLELRTGRP